MILGQEALHTMKKKKGKTFLVGIKIDINTTYDNMKWKLIRQILMRHGFSN